MRQRCLGAVAVYAVFLMLLISVSTLGNRIVGTGHLDLPTPTRLSAGP